MTDYDNKKIISKPLITKRESNEYKLTIESRVEVKLNEEGEKQVYINSTYFLTDKKTNETTEETVEKSI